MAFCLAELELGFSNQVQNKQNINIKGRAVHSLPTRRIVFIIAVR